jgi:hypothetical protein
VTQPDPRRERLRALYDELAVPDPWPERLDESEQDAWMDRVGADGDLAGLLSSAIHGQRFEARELKEYRGASERFGSRLDAAKVDEAYRLLGER